MVNRRYDCDLSDFERTSNDFASIQSYALFTLHAYTYAIASANIMRLKSLSHMELRGLG
jgi:hypothetical protein